MSGVMIKMGIFMIIRMFVDIIPQGSLWWGFVILIIGGLSSLLGVLYALAEHDIKRLLAYHSIENIGIILLGVGSAMIFNVFGAERLAAMALIAALFHTINHALFKSLLFFGAGSVISKTHTRDIEEYGGLIKTMPYTAVFFLIGAVAISGLPPFNGFASEWLTFQSLFAGISAKSMIIKSVFMFGAASLAFTGGLAAACFVKAFGITFLARPRSIHAEHAKESDLTMQIGMGIVAFLCLILGILSGRFTNILTVAIHQIGFLAGQGSAFDTYGNTIVVNNGFAVLNLAYVFMGALLTLALTALLVYLLSRNQKTTIKGIWDCGFSYSTSRMEITSTGFARSLILVFRSIFRPQKEHEVEYSSSDSRYFTKSRTVTLSTVNVYETYFYYPTLRALNFISAQVKKTQNGNVNLYLFYITVILIGLLIWSRFS
jgi:hydrogenase-4 component B